MFSIVTAFLSFFILCHAGNEKYPPQGEGIVGVVITSSPGHDLIYEKPTIIKRYKYFIKGYKIFQCDTADQIQQWNNSKETKPNSDKISVAVSGGVKTINPVYLIDLKTLLTYTYFKKHKKLFISVDSLSRTFFDNYYRQLSTPKKDKIEYEITSESELIAGKKCFTGGIITATKDTIFLKYTKETMKVSSPLNCVFSQCQYPILAIKFPRKYKGDISDQLDMRIDFLSETKIDDDIFKLLPNSGLLRDVPKADLLKGANIN